MIISINWTFIQIFDDECLDFFLRFGIQLIKMYIDREHIFVDFCILVMPGYDLCTNAYLIKKKSFLLFWFGNECGQILIEMVLTKLAFKMRDDFSAISSLSKWKYH